MKLQRLMHSKDDIVTDKKFDLITHVVNEITLGGEYTVCGRAIPDAIIEEGWQAVGSEFNGTIKQCDCKDCRQIISWFKMLK